MGSRLRLVQPRSSVFRYFESTAAMPDLLQSCRIVVFGPDCGPATGKEMPPDKELKRIIALNQVRKVGRTPGRLVPSADLVAVLIPESFKKFAIGKSPRWVSMDSG